MYYRIYPEYIQGVPETARRLLRDAKEFLDEFPMRLYFHCIAGPNNQRYIVSRKGTEYWVRPVTT